MKQEDRIGISSIEKGLREKIAVLERRVNTLQTENFRLKGENDRLKATVK